MLVIYLHHSQVGLLEVLREVCPDLALAPRSLYPGYVTYRATLAEGEAGLGQTACLRRLHILYLDTEALRERRARACAMPRWTRRRRARFRFRSPAWRLAIPTAMPCACVPARASARRRSTCARTGRAASRLPSRVGWARSGSTARRSG